MQKIEQKQLEKLREVQKKREDFHNDALREIIQDDSVKIILKYCKEILSQPFTQNLSDYSPTYLSKFIFDEELQHAKNEFAKLPHGQSKIQHFLSLMIKTMKFPFQKWPFYLVGLKDMFNEIKPERKDVITYSMFFKYVIGEVLDFKEEEQNTEFQVRFQELKKQDYLLHDTGIKKFYYSNDLKIYFTLDQGSNVLKLYNKEMKIICRFSPNKEKHNKKFPTIVWFDYNELNNKLGLLLSDSTLSIINFQAFLQKSILEFQSVNSNEIVIPLKQKMVRVVYIQMLNRWGLISDLNKFYLFDLEKYRQQDPNYMVQVKMDDPDLFIGEVLELVNLSVICVVTGNEINFFNENFTEQKYTKFVHGSNIKTLRYNEQNNTFYVCGDEKKITTFSISRTGAATNIDTFETSVKANICSFDIFPTIGTLILVDENNEVRLYDEGQKICYQTQNYSQIVKNENQKIKLLRTGKTEFALYETYTLVFEQDKIAIQKDIQYSFLQDTYYDKIKEEFYFSVNQQIISFSVSHGQIRKSYNHNTSNVPKHETFNRGKNMDLFIIDHHKNIYEAYLKDANIAGQNRNYRKKLSISSVVRSFLDEEIRFIFVVGDKSIFSIRNDGNNNFTVNSVLNLEDFPPITNAKYNSTRKELQLFTKQFQFYTLSAETYKLLNSYVYVFPKDPKQHEEKLIFDSDFNEELNINIILTNQNEIYIVECYEFKKQIYFKIDDYLPLKYRNLKFTNLKYSPKQTDHDQNSLFIWDTTGYLAEFDLTKVLSSTGFKKEEQFSYFKYPVKETHNLKSNQVQMQKINLIDTKCDKLDKKNVLIFKPHEKEIKIISKINIEGIHTLTFSIDGNIKLWKKDKCLFNLKLPDLKKHIWEMSEIEKIKNDRSIGEIMKILQKINTFIEEKSSPEKLIKSESRKQSKNPKEVKKVNYEEPIPLDIENKDIEDIVNKTQNINWYTFSGDSKKKQSYMLNTSRANPHPWRTKTNFLKIFEKASPVNKYKKKMPKDLVSLRVSLDMKDRREFQSESKRHELFILPELNSYVPEKHSSQKKREVQNQEEDNEEAFESCLYVKKSKFQNKINELDEIDKEFKKKWMILSERKWIPTRKDRQKKNDSNRKIKLKADTMFAPIGENKYDPIKQIQGIFESHNRQTAATKKGRFIRIPEIKIKKEELMY